MVIGLEEEKGHRIWKIIVFCLTVIVGMRRKASGENVFLTLSIP